MNEFIQTLSLGGTGPSIAIKDTIDIAGYATTAASRALADAPPAQQHAEVVERLLDPAGRSSARRICTNWRSA